LQPAIQLLLEKLPQTNIFSNVSALFVAQWLVFLQMTSLPSRITTDSSSLSTISHVLSTSLANTLSLTHLSPYFLSLSLSLSVFLSFSLNDIALIWLLYFYLHKILP
jgi:hypothetical protein